MGFSTKTGTVTVDADSKTTREISYRKFDVEPTTSLVEVMEAIQGETFPVWDGDKNSVGFVKVTEEITLAFDKEGKAILDKDDVQQLSGISLTQLLADAIGRFCYTSAVSIAKGKFNNSPEKTDSNMTKLLQAIIDNPETAPDRKKKAQAMLSVLQTV